MINLDPELKIINLVKKVQKIFGRELKNEELAKAICDFYKIKIDKRCLSSESEGCTIADNNCIILNENYQYKPRYLFTFFHEIVHCLIKMEGLGGEEIFEILNDYAVKNFEDSIEKICDLGASEFLLPEEVIKDKVNNGNIDLNLFRRLFIEIQDVSPPAIARKLAYIAPYPAIFTICTPKMVIEEIGSIVEGEERAMNSLVVEYYFNTKHFQYPLKRFNPIPENHLLSQAFQNNEDLNGEDNFPFSKQSTKMPCYVDCFTDSNRVYAILYEKKLIVNKDQLSMF